MSKRSRIVHAYAKLAAVFFVVLGLHSLTGCKTESQPASDVEGANSNSGTDPFKKFSQLFPAGNYKGTTLGKADCFMKIEGSENEEYIAVRLLRAMNTSPTNVPLFSVSVERGGRLVSIKDYKETITGQEIKSSFSLYVTSQIASQSSKKYEIEVDSRTSGTRIVSFAVTEGVGPTHATHSCQNLTKLKD